MKTYQKLLGFDPRAANFRCGLEVHQQLNTKHKLFCRCPAGLYSEDYDATALRHMRPTLSELGEYDGTALMEFKTKKNILYLINKASVCTYEMDDNPPFPINREAVNMAIEIALMLNCSIVGELHVSRKQYLDGSIPAGFQRTAIVGVNGWIPFKGRKIGINQLALEEDACREVSDVGHVRTYLTDRLSMPLIEVVTAPDILEPDETLEVGQLIARIVRATGNVRRGIGSVRQDVNVSVEGGTRIEIKGVPRLPIIPRLTYYEAYRQQKLLELQKEMLSRGFDPENTTFQRFDITDKLENSLLQDAAVLDEKVGAILLKNMRGLLSFNIGPRRRFADDISGRIRVIACIQHRPVILHTDPEANPPLSPKDHGILREITGMTDDDCVVITWGDPTDVETALKEIEIRCREAATDIPSETRQVLSNGETDFERILPGPDRMYPDTDSPPYAIDQELVNKIRTELPERPWDTEERLRKLNLSDHLVERLVQSPYLELFGKLVDELDIPASFTAHVLGDLTTYTHRIGGDKLLSNSVLSELFNLFNSKGLCREAIRMLLEESAMNDDSDWESLIDKLHLITVSESEAPAIIEKVVEGLGNSCPKDPEKRFKFAMGEVMENYRGRIPGKLVSDVVRESL